MKRYEVLYRIRRPARHAVWVETFGTAPADGTNKISQRSNMASDAMEAPCSRGICPRIAQEMGAAYGTFSWTVQKPCEEDNVGRSGSSDEQGARRNVLLSLRGEPIKSGLSGYRLLFGG